MRDLHAAPPKTLFTKKEFQEIFLNPAEARFVGVFDTEREALDNWKANAQRTVDNALMRFFVNKVFITKMSPQDYFAFCQDAAG